VANFSVFQKYIDHPFTTLKFKSGQNIALMPAEAWQGTFPNRG
jgi:hypothetical protein